MGYWIGRSRTRGSRERRTFAFARPGYPWNTVKNVVVGDSLYEINKEFDSLSLAIEVCKAMRRSVLSRSTSRLFISEKSPATKGSVVWNEEEGLVERPAPQPPPPVVPPPLTVSSSPSLRPRRRI